MKKLIVFSIFFSAFLINSSFAQFKTEPLSLKPETSQYKRLSLTKPNITSRIALGINAGFALIEENSGLAIGVFTEIQGNGFSFVPQANYWKVEKTNNFELAGLARLRLGSFGLIPYVDGGIGVNFYSNDEANKNFTKLGLDVGGGIEMGNLGQNFNLIFDAKYKIIINDPGNINGVVLTAGIKFPLE